MQKSTKPEPGRTVAESPTPDEPRGTLMRAALRLLLPLVRLLLRHGVSYPVAADLLRWAYVDVASRDFGIEGRMQTKSRVAVLTGMTRREVSRLFDAPPPTESQGPERYNRAARVLTGWREDADFLDDTGRPRVLALNGDDCSFAELVRRYSGNAPTRAVLDELLRVNAVRQRDDGVELVHAYYVPPEGRESDADKFEIMGMSASDLIRTIGHNLDPGKAGPFFQRVVFTRDLTAEQLPRARALMRGEGQELADRADAELFRLAREGGRPQSDAPRHRVGIGLYYFEEPAGDTAE